jgi:hypothetical protein
VNDVHGHERLVREGLGGGEAVVAGAAVAQAVLALHALAAPTHVRHLHACALS